MLQPFEEEEVPEISFDYRLILLEHVMRHYYMMPASRQSNFGRRGQKRISYGLEMAMGLSFVKFQ